MAKSRRVAEFVGGLYGDYDGDNNYLKKAMKVSWKKFISCQQK